MELKFQLLLFFTVFSFGKSQFAIRYPTSEFQNIQLGQPPNGIYIPPDSFLNALRNHPFRSSFPTVPQVNPNPVNYNPPAPQSTFYLQPPPAIQLNSIPPTDMTNTNQVEEERPRRRTVRRRQRISMEQNGTPMTYSPSVFENIGYGEVPEGVYVPPDSLLNILRKPSNERRNIQRPSQIATANNFGLTRSYQPIMNEEQTQQNTAMEAIIPEAQPETFSSSNMDPEEYGRKLSSRNRESQTTQGRQMPRNRRPPSIALDPSMEYPADIPREKMQWVPHSAVQYDDFNQNKRQRSSRQRTPKRRQSQRKRKQTVAKPDYDEPEYSSRTYSPSVFENIGFGEPPSGVRIPSDSMLNILREDDQVARRSTPVQQPSAPMSVPSSDEEMQMAENPSQYSRMKVTRKCNRQGCRESISSDPEADGDFGSRRRSNNNVQTFRESSQQRPTSQRRNSGVSRRSRNEE